MIMPRSFWVKSLTILCTLLLAMGAVAGTAQPSSISIDASQPAHHQAASVNAALSIFFLNTDGNATEASIAVDKAGGVHIAASPMGAATDGTYPAYYAYCASSCSSAANWTILELENLGFWGGYVRLALDSNGHPRMVWNRELTMSNGEYRYAECNTHCTSFANWKIGSTGPSYSADEGRYFALDNLNRPRLVLYNYIPQYSGTWYRLRCGLHHHRQLVGNQGHQRAIIPSCTCIFLQWSTPLSCRGYRSLPPRITVLCLRRQL
jgi:hypothetical protein